MKKEEKPKYWGYCGQCLFEHGEVNELSEQGKCPVCETDYSAPGPWGVSGGNG